MTRRGGPRTAVNPRELVTFLDAWSEHLNGGHPVRTRKFINGLMVSETDARMIRRWRTGAIKGVTAKSADALLKRYCLYAIYKEDA